MSMNFSVKHLNWLSYETDENGFSPRFSQNKSLKIIRITKQLQSLMETINIYNVSRRICTK